ncbi:MAG: chemotaxis protein CheW [Actinomycetota bacterium]
MAARKTTVPAGAGGPGEVERVLQKRAEALARPVESDDAAIPTIEMLVLAVGAERYGIPVRRVGEVRPLGSTTPVPGLPAFWAGLINLRGALLPVLDLRRFLAVEESVFSDPPQAVVVTGQDFDVALMVDDVQGVERFRATDISPSLSGASSAVLGVTTDLVSVLDIDRLLADGALIVHDGVARTAADTG